MPVIDLTRYVVASDGPWTDPSQDENLFGFTVNDTVSAERLLLRWAGDFVALTGPLSIRVTVQAENMTVPLALVGNLSPGAGVWQRGAMQTSPGVETLQRPAAAALNEAALQRFGKTHPLGLQASTIYSYTLDIAAGQAWPFSLSEHLESYRLQNTRGSRFEQLGNNLGYRVIIEPAFARPKLTAVSAGADLPCDFAVADQPHSADFFPSACEPCNGSVVGLPPGCAVSLVTPPAEGGCVRTHFFDGMFITREDLETEQRYHRLKSKLHNRAAGEGVVWGLAIGKQGTHVCVMPGYGVDCCGNDLALTTVYEVEIAALLADPAIAKLLHQGGPQRVALLLEYVECPSHPRPVHGDVCAPELARCEMSRIREAVRLRLVPPRDPNDCVESVPIAQFLAEVRELRRRYPMETVPPVAGADRAPFTLRIVATSGMQSTITVRPSSHSGPAELQPLLGGTWSTISIDLRPDPLWSFVGGTITAQAMRQGKSLSNVVTPAGPVDLSLAGGFALGDRQTTFAFSAQTGFPDQLVFKISNWQAQSLFAAEDDPAPSGDLTLSFEFSEAAAANNLAPELTTASLLETPIRNLPMSLADPPCAGDACKPPRRTDQANDCRVPAGRPATGFQAAFNRILDSVAEDPPSVLPWLHADPAHPQAAGDPKALLLGALGAWLAQAMVRERAGSAGEVTGPRREAAQAIYRAAWVLLFGVGKRADAAELGGTLKRLLEAWCDALLWKGPQCCGEPHGVVLGCALVEGGTLQHLDPFGGRRHVVHYPLLAHWGAQFGIAPLDITASALFSKICCIGSLPAIGGQSRETKAAWIQLGSGYLALGEPRDIDAAFNNALNIAPQNAKIVSRRSVGTPEMIATAIAAIGRKSNSPPTEYVALSLADVAADQTVVLFVPA